MNSTIDAKLTDFAAGITAIDTDYVRPLLDASHLVIESGKALFVDTGTTHSVPNLMAALARKNIDAADVEWVLTTHVHLDHAGGAGALMRQLPNARCAVHPRGARHLADPGEADRGHHCRVRRGAVPHHVWRYRAHRPGTDRRGR